MAVATTVGKGANAASSIGSASASTSKTAKSVSSAASAVSSVGNLDTNPNIYLTQARVYIAGVLMPTISVSITTTFDRPPLAEIALPAFPELFYVGEADRVPVHIFVQETVVESSNFILMFEGFVASVNYVNSAVQRTISLTATSYFDFLNDVKIKFLTQLQDMYLQYIPGGSATFYQVVQDNITFPQSLFRYGLVRPDENNKDGNREPKKIIKVPSDYLENVYAFVQFAKAMEEGSGATGKQDEDAQKNVSEGKPPYGALHGSVLAEYYAKLAKTLKLLDRFEPLPYFDKKGSTGKFAWEESGYNEQNKGDAEDMSTTFPMLYGMQNRYAIEQLSKGAERAGMTQSIMEFLRFLVSEMEYEYTLIPNPAFHTQKKEDTKDEKKSDSIQQKGKVVTVIGTVKAEEAQQQQGQQAAASSQQSNQKTNESAYSNHDQNDKLVSSCMKPLLNDSIPPQCNVVYRTLVSDIRMSFQYKGVPTRVVVNNIYAPLADLAANSGNTALAMYGLIDYYPSEKYEGFDPPDPKNPKHVRYLGSELLEVEKYTGPWVVQVGTPRWFHYLEGTAANGNFAQIKGPDGNEIDAEKVFKERFCRRQLANAKYMQRQVVAATMFDPYITAGFPGVIFDNEGSNFAFAGHITAVMHHISPTEMSTQISMNFARQLHEAAHVEIPHPINAIHLITHNSDKMTEVYQQILGTPGSSIPGAKALTYTDLLDISESNDVEENKNPQKAYQAKRRNVCTFEQYCSFMGLSATMGNGPEGPSTPVLLTGDFVENRRPITIFASPKVKTISSENQQETGSTQKTGTIQQDPNAKQPQGTQQQQQQQQTKQEQAKIDSSDNTGKEKHIPLKEKGINIEAIPDEIKNSPWMQQANQEKSKQAQQEKAKTKEAEANKKNPSTPTTNRLTSQSETKAEAKKEETKSTQIETYVDVRTVLRSIAEKEFSHMVYQ